MVRRSEGFAAGFVLVLWTAAAALVAVAHEPWRDEVRALSLATGAESILDLPRALRNEGHPVLWYALLRLAPRSPVSIKVLSLALSAVATALFLFRAPFPFVLRALFVFGSLTFYEFPVVSQNYALAYPLFLAFAAFWPGRHERPLPTGLVLAALANVNAFTCMFSGFLALYWVLASLPLRRPRTALFAAALYAAAALFAASVIRVDADSIVPKPSPGGPLFTLGAAARGVGLLPWTLDAAIPGLPAASRLVLVLMLVLGLAPRPLAAVFAATSLAAFGIATEVFYGASARHEGMLYLLLVTLHWIARADPPAAVRAAPRALAKATLFAALPALFALHAVEGSRLAVADLSGPYSMSRRLHEVTEPNAVLVGEPDFLLESLPYYGAHRIYLARENRYGDFARFTRAARLNLSLGELLAEARRIRNETGRGVYLVLGEDLSAMRPGGVSYPFRRTFRWSMADLADLWRTARLVRVLRGSMSGEDYDVFELR